LFGFLEWPPEARFALLLLPFLPPGKEGEEERKKGQ